MRKRLFGAQTPTASAQSLGTLLEVTAAAIGKRSEENTASSRRIYQEIEEPDQGVTAP